MSWYINRRKRPPVVALGLAGLCWAGWYFFLVTNRGSIYIGSSFDVKTDVSNIVESSDTGNEWIYGAGTVLSSQRRDHYFWMRRYLAQIMVRPIPSSIWPTKYADFGVPELLHNAGTGEGLRRHTRLEGGRRLRPRHRRGSLVEVWWFAIPLMGLLGWLYGWVWRKSAVEGGPWVSQLIVLRRHQYLSGHADDGGGDLPLASFVHTQLAYLALRKQGCGTSKPHKRHDFYK